MVTDVIIIKKKKKRIEKVSPLSPLKSSTLYFYRDTASSYILILTQFRSECVPNISELKLRKQKGGKNKKRKRRKKN